MSDEAIGLDDDSVSELDQAKKGKPRMFVMLCKGVKIQKMFVFRKGQPSSYVQQAKREGFKGAVYSGVITGKGQELTFELARAEGYDAPPGKELVLKDFLKAHDFKCDPSYAIVDTLTEVREDDVAQPESEPSTPPPPAPPAPPPPAPPPPTTPSPASTAPPPPSPLAAEFANRLKALKPDLDRVLASQVPLVAQVAQLAATAAAQARKSDFTTALQSLGQLETLVAEALKQLAATASEDPAVEFNERLKKLLPAIKEAAGTAIADSVKLLSSEAGTLARGKKLAEAHQKLDELEKLLQRSGRDGEAAKPGTTSNEFPKLWAEAKSAWQNAIDTVNGQLEKLAAALRKANDEELKDIAEFGLNAVTNNHRVRLQAAMMEVDGANAEALPSKAARASHLVLDFRDHLEVDERVQACDENPFDVTVAIRAELVPALTKLEEALSQATTA